ncbi:DUF4971 domain-containing protein [Bacteroides sp.]|uniref:DUF4971 domain-containing protein n=1 Tax=Bacteroides sp. TaxID=29523 RepID=UPI0025C504A1|nr:DUF4971 domain-containing protein [Bacteroides sp.]
MMRHVYTNCKLKYFFWLILLFIGVSHVCCSNDNKITNEGLLSSFVVWMNEQKIEAVVDNENHQIIISGVKDGSQITNLGYTLIPGTTLYPDPHTYLNNWEREERFVARSTDNQITYTIILKDYEIPLDNALKINLNERKQRILLVGGDMERSQFFLQKAANPEEVAQWCFQDIHFDVCRVSYDKKQELEEGQKNLSFYEDAVKSMKLLQAVNSNIQFWATMKSDYNGYNNENNLPEWICDYKPTTRFDCAKYAVFLADYLEYMQNNGVPVKYLAIAKEWVGVINAERAKQIILRLNAECLARGITKPLYVDPASWGITQGVNFIKSAKENGSLDLYYGFSTHNLNNNESDQYLYEMFVEEARRNGKYAFADETGIGSGGRTNGVEPETLDAILDAYQEKAEFYKDGIQGEIFFEPFSRGVNSETRSIYFKKGEEAKRMRSYYVMKVFANAIAGNTMWYVPIQAYGIKDDVYTMAFVNDEELFITIINKNENDLKDVSLLLDGASLEGKAEQILFDISLPIEGQSEKLTMANNSLTVNLPSKSIVFLSIKL